NVHSFSFLSLGQPALNFTGMLGSLRGINTRGRNGDALQRWADPVDGLVNGRKESKLMALRRGSRSFALAFRGPISARNLTLARVPNEVRSWPRAHAVPRSDTRGRRYAFRGLGNAPYSSYF